jgi:hypothetical protein
MKALLYFGTMEDMNPTPPHPRRPETLNSIVLRATIYTS